MAAACAVEIPTVSFYKLNRFADFHSAILAIAMALVNRGGQLAFDLVLGDQFIWRVTGSYCAIESIALTYRRVRDRSEPPGRAAPARAPDGAARAIGGL
jgi:hypothetical protein